MIRPGDNLYEVDDRVEVTAVTPRYISNDIYVSHTLANHITQLARQAVLLAEASKQRSCARQVSEEQQLVNAPALHGTIVLNATPLKGADALLVTGAGAAVGTRADHASRNALPRNPKRAAQPSRPDGRAGWKVPSRRADRARLHA